MNKKSKFFYYLFKTIIGLAGIVLGTIIGALFLYPLMLSFPSNILVVFIGLYIIIVLAVLFCRLFNKSFLNYLNYKPLFKHINFKFLFSQKTTLLAFYIFGLIFFFFFIAGLF
jgi:uncharacterized protein YacL